MKIKNHKITSESRVTKAAEKFWNTAHFIASTPPYEHRDHILNVKHCTYFFSCTPRSLAHYFSASGIRPVAPTSTGPAVERRVSSRV